MTTPNHPRNPNEPFAPYNSSPCSELDHHAVHENESDIASSTTTQPDGLYAAPAPATNTESMRGPRRDTTSTTVSSPPSPEAVNSGADSPVVLELRGGGLNARDTATRNQPPTKDDSRDDAAEPAPATKRKANRVHITEGSPEVIGSQQSIHEYRARLAQEMERREQAAKSPPASGNVDKTRKSPNREDPVTITSPTPDLDMPTASTESNKTVRGFATPGFAARTPSYPFPRMVTPGFNPSPLQQALSQQSQLGLLKSAGAQFGGLSLQDNLRSDPSTPASALTFQPADAIQFPENYDYPTPNLYDLTLKLSSEPGLDAWWNNVVQILTESYRAERATLYVPADSTDVENVPWGQKATYSAQEEDEFSMGYLSRGGAESFMTGGADDHQSDNASTFDSLPKSDLLKRPGFQSRHSFTTYEDKRESGVPTANEFAGLASQRPGLTSRSKSYYPGTTKRDSPTSHPALNQQALEEHDAIEEQQAIPSWEATLDSNRENKGRVLPVLQGLDLEADPLIDHDGITRVIQRGKVIALTRTYPYLEPGAGEQDKSKSSRPSSKESKKTPRNPTRSESGAKLSSLLANASAPRPGVGNTSKSRSTGKSKNTSLFSFLDDAPPRAPSPKYEEFEQAPPSPWSQSPAPSPAVRADPAENPFFTDAMVDEDSFNPGPSPQDYTSAQPPETIGIDNSWTVLHIPLNHILLSKPQQRFQLDFGALEQKTSSRGKTGLTKLREQLTSSEGTTAPRQPPIAILSILSPVIPYPSNLRHSLEHLAPHLATSFSLCRHYSNIETEVRGLHRRRPATAGFGAVGPDGRPLTEAGAIANLHAAPPEDISQRSISGSITSPSDYSAPSRSMTASPMGTPLWEAGSFGLVVERRGTGNSPGQAVGDSYFNSKPRNPGVPHEMPSGTSPFTARTAREGGTGKVHKRSGSLRHQSHEPTTTQNSEAPEPSSVTIEDAVSQVSKHRPTSKDSGDVRIGANEPTSKQDVDDGKLRLPGHSSHRHTLLHSYGADVATSLQSLPPGSSLTSRPALQSLPSKSGPTQTAHVSMLPPSDRLKGVMLDLLPVQVFVALPQTGEIVWVNGRYLNYRGQTLTDLIADPWGSIHEEDRDDYLRAWTQTLRSGEQFAHSVRLRRFDGTYRWHHARAVASKDKRGVIVQFIGSYMDIHEQKVAEAMAVRQREIEVSEAKHRLLANLIPQIIFTATEDAGITFANEQWLSYTGQGDEAAAGLGFMEYVHPDDLARCRLPVDRKAAAMSTKGSGTETPSEYSSSTVKAKPATGSTPSDMAPARSVKATPDLSRNTSFASSSANDSSTADLNELVKKGVIKVGTDSNGRLSYTTELRLRSRSGEYRWHLIRCVEIGDVGFGGNESSYFGSATDINDHKLLEAKLKEAMESKGRFLSNMSHEIRTPLIGISGMVSFLQDTTLNEEQRDYTNTIQTSANSLLMIINDILDLSKVDAGMMKLKYEWFHTRSLIEDVNELVSTMAIAKRLELNYIVEESVPIWVKGDKVRIRQVLLNVIGNAIKFTSEGEVFSRCRVYTDNESQLDEHQIQLEFSVMDTGRGFTKEEAGLIFKPFSQIDGSSTRQHGGSGLGLVISRQLVELHGGRMDGTAVLGEGSTFTFTAVFNLPHAGDHPNVPSTPPMNPTMRAPSDQKATQAIKPLLLQRAMDVPSTASPGSDADVVSPALTSSASSDPSIRSARTQTTTRSSVSSVNVGLVHFSEAAKASGQDLSQMKLEMPSAKLSPLLTPALDGSKSSPRPEQLRPPMYSILIICPQLHSREATTKHIEMTLPKDVPHQITAMATVAEAEKLIGGHESVTFTHIVLNLGSADEVMGVIGQIMANAKGNTSVVILSDSAQRQAVLKRASDPKHQQLLAEKRIIFVYKPVKPSRFAVIFDPDRERDLSIDLNRSSAAQMVESQKQNLLDIEKKIGNKGYRVLLVEDNPVNQKVLVRYLKKVGVDAEVARDGVECTEKVFAHPPKHYALILCDLHMPRKDGYQACRDIREWETKGRHPSIPIIALSANVMSDVQEKCNAAGFNDYVTKPVDFVDLSNAMSKFF